MDRHDGRTAYLDYLRVFATFAVMVIHVAAQNWYGTEVTGFAWNAFNLYDSAARWSVPVFVMISGALFLSRDIDVRKLYGKYILRLVIAYFVWSFLYALFAARGPRAILRETVMGHYHMWFLRMIVGLYICVPVLRALVQSRRTMRYYLIVAFLFALLLPLVRNLISDLGFGPLQTVADRFYSLVDSLDLNLFLGYTVYFVCGYALYTTELTRRQRRWIYIAGGAGLLFTAAATAYFSIRQQQANANYYSFLSVNTFLATVAVFVWAQYNIKDHARFQGAFARLSQYSFGAYLVHALILEQLARLGLNTLSFSPLFSVPLITVLVGVLSFGVSALLHQIPLLKKYIV